MPSDEEYDVDPDDVAVLVPLQLDATPPAPAAYDAATLAVLHAMEPGQHP
ncbi:hypothetical protein ACFV27_37290 [Streptomyces antimycoticus]